MTRVFRYPTAALVPDYLRAGFGLVVVGLPLGVADLPTSVALLLALVACLFLAFGARTLRRQRLRLEVSDRGVSTGPGRTPIAWSALDRCKLSYFSVRRDREDGWMELTLHAANRSLTVDSRLDGFADLAAWAARSARLASLPMDAASVANFKALRVADGAAPLEGGEMAS